MNVELVTRQNAKIYENALCRHFELVLEISRFQLKSFSKLIAKKIESFFHSFFFRYRDDPFSCWSDR